MAKTPINTIKQWFRTGSKPTQEQFWNFMDSYWHKDDDIPQESIDGLSDDLAKKADINQLSNKANAEDLIAAIADVELLKTNKADVSTLNTKANKDASNIEAEKYYEAIKPFIPASNGGGSGGVTKPDVVKMLGDIVIGGANLVKNTALPRFTPNSAGKGTPETMSDSTGYFVRITPNASNVVSVYGFFLADSHTGKHSMSMDFRHSHTGNIMIWGQSIPPNVWVRLKKEAFTATNGWSGFSSDIPGVPIDVRHYKRELGSKATDWGPHIDEFVLGANAKKIDDVFIPDKDGVSLSRDPGNINTVIVNGIPYAKDISAILECYFIYSDGTSQKITAVNADGTGGIRFSASLVAKTLTKIYLKALIK